MDESAHPMTLDVGDWVCTWLAARWQPSTADLPPAPNDAEFAQRTATWCAHHRLSGALLAVLTHQSEFARSPLLHWLEIATEVETQRMAGWSGHIANLLSRFNQVGIPYCLLKGWALLPGYYANDPRQRPGSDLDVLVPRQTVSEAIRLLRQAGYTNALPEQHPGFTLRYLYEQTYIQPSTIPVQLHWDLLPSLQTTEHLFEGLLARRTNTTLFDQTAWAPHPVDHLLYLCGHLGLHHQYETRLFRYFDIALLIHLTTRRLDWEMVQTIAVQTGLVLPLQRTLARLELLWPGILPDNVNQIIQGLRASRLEQRLHALAAEHPRTPARELRLLLWRQPRWGDKITLLMAMAFPSSDYMQWQYGTRPVGLSWTRYLDRFSRVLIER